MTGFKRFYGRQKFISLLLHPLAFSLILSLIFYLTVPTPIPDYTVQIVNMMGGYPGQLIVWDDLENDTHSDRIIAYTSNAGTTSLTVNLMPTAFIKNWTFHGKTMSARKEYLATGDYNTDGHREIYIFTNSGDSILLHAVNDFRSENPALENRFISKVGMFTGKSDAEVIMGEMEDLNLDGYKELVFAITSGESLFPRTVFAYDIRHDSLWSSPKMGMQIQGLIQADGDGDGVREIYIEGYAPANIGQVGYPFTDSCC